MKAQQGDLVALLPYMIGYHPDPGHVTVMAIDPAGTVGVTVCIREDLDADNAAPIGQGIAEIASEVGADGVVIFGHEVESAHLEQVSRLARINTKVFDVIEVRADTWRVLGDEHFTTTPPADPAITDKVPSPAPSKAAQMLRWAPIPEEQIPDALADEATTVTETSSTHFRTQARGLVKILQTAGPTANRFPPEQRAMVAAGIDYSTWIRDAVLLAGLKSPQVAANLDYLARTANPAHASTANSVAAAVAHLNREGTAKTEAFLTHAGDTNLAQLIQTTLNTSIDPSEMRQALLEKLEQEYESTFNRAPAPATAAHSQSASVPSRKASGPSL